MANSLDAPLARNVFRAARSCLSTRGYDASSMAVTCSEACVAGFENFDFQFKARAPVTTRNMDNNVCINHATLLTPVWPHRCICDIFCCAALAAVRMCAQQCKCSKSHLSVVDVWQIYRRATHPGLASRVARRPVDGRPPWQERWPDSSYDTSTSPRTWHWRWHT